MKIIRAEEYLRSPEGIIERFLQGTNQGRFQTIQFQLRYLGRFGPEEKEVLWDEDNITVGSILPGSEITMYLSSLDDTEIILGFPVEEDELTEDLYIVHTVREGSTIMDNLRTYIDHLRMKWRTRS